MSIHSFLQQQKKELVFILLVAWFVVELHVIWFIRDPRPIWNFLTTYKPY